MKTKTIRYAVINGIFAACVYFGMIEGIEGARNVAIFFAWFLFIVSTFMLSEDVTAKYMEESGSGPSVPRWIDISYDAAIACMFVWGGATITAAAYLIQTIISASFFDRVAKLRSKQA